MKKHSRLLALLLCAAMLLPACAKDSDDDKPGTGTTSSSDTSASVVDDTTVDPSDRSVVKDNVPEDLKFDGENIRVVIRGDPNGTANYLVTYDVMGTDNAGDYVTDGVYERNRTVEERLNVTMNVTGFNGNQSEVGSQIKTLLMSGSDEFDYIHATGNTTLTLGLNLYLRDLANMPYVDYDADWWWKDVAEAVSLDGKTYNYIYGDMLIYCYIQTGVVYYNKTLYEDAFGDPDEMYKVVTDGEWTIDKLMELTAAAYTDANGDGVENAGDIFGSIKTSTQGEESIHFLHGFDLDLYSRDDNGNLLIDFDQERCMTAIEKLSKYFNETEGVFQSDGYIDDESGRYFVQNYAVFFPARLSRVLSADFRNMEDPYGILPYPKLDEDQTEYLSLIHDSSSNICVPKTVSDERFEIVGAWLECLSAESWRSVMPQFLDTALKVKYSQDSYSGQVIDLVISGVTKNTLAEYTTYTSDIFTTALVNPSRYGTKNFASAYRKLGPASQKSWDKAVEKIIGE